MMSAEDHHIFKILTARIREHFSSAQVWAFGSRAWGDASGESDLDVCVVVERLTHEDRRIIRRIGWEVGFENDRLICTVIYGKDAFEQGPCIESPLVRTILDEGIPA